MDFNTWIHIFQYFAILINFILFIFMYIKINKNNTCDKTIKTLNRNFDLIDSLYKKQNSDNFKKMVELYSQVQTILKISECSLIALFRYDYIQTRIKLNFLFSINQKGEILHESYLDNLPATCNKLNMEIMKSSDDELSDLTLGTLKDDTKIYQLLKYRNIEKIYFKNINRHSDNPLGYVAFSYENNYVLDDVQREEILRILNKISDLL